MFEAIQLCLELKGQTLLNAILEALSLKAKKETKPSQDEGLDTEERIDRDAGAIERPSRETEQPESEAVLKIVCNMKEKIRGIKETLGREDKKEKNLLDRPNPAGSTLLHISSSLNDGETTRLLLKHGADANLQDAEGNSPLHIVCRNKDIQTAICILKKNGTLLTNKNSQTASIEELFFGQPAKDVDELLKAVNQSNYRKEFLDKILEKEYTLFRLVEEDKPEILALVLEKLSAPEQETYVNLVCHKIDGNTALHLATLTDHKSLKCASLLLGAGARFVTNACFSTPAIEDFFMEENEDEITTALVDGLIDKVMVKQLDQHRALKLLIPVDKTRKSLFQKAKPSNWEVIAKWAGEDNIKFSPLVSRMTASELEKMVEVAREGHWEKENVNALLCEEKNHQAILLSSLDFNFQQEVAFWNQTRTNQIAYKMGKEFVQWLVQQANEGTWNGEELGAAFCQLNSENKLKLSTLDVELQKQLAVLNKEKTCLSAPLLGNNLQQWLYQEAEEARWDEDLVFRVLEKKETEGGAAVSAKVKNLGMYDIETLSDK